MKDSQSVMKNSSETSNSISTQPTKTQPEEPNPISISDNVLFNVNQIPRRRQNC